MINPWRDNLEQFGLKVQQYEAPGSDGFDWDYLLVIKASDGVRIINDSGCSCYCPFEDYEETTINGVLVECGPPVRDARHAREVFDDWGKGWPAGNANEKISQRIHFSRLLADWGVV